MSLVSPRSVRRLRRQRRGVVAVLAAFLIVGLLLMVAFAIDIGMMGVVKTDLQRAADSGALAAAGRLVDAPGAATVDAQRFARLNRVAGDALNPSDVDAQIGTWDPAARVFTPNAEPANAVKVLTRKNNIPFAFGRVAGTTDFSLQASAVAVFQPRDIMLVLDYSGSMNDDNKINGLKSSVNLFCGLVQRTSGGRDRVGFVRYSTNATMEQTLTNNVAQVNTAAQLGSANGFTNIGDALHLANDELLANGRARARKMIVLLTDGLANRPTNRDPIRYVEDEAVVSRDRGFPIVAVSFGFDADQRLMQTAATTTRGVHFHVQGGPFASQEAQLESVFRQVAFNRRLALVE